MADIMQRRNSPLIKTVFVVAGLGSIVYLMYLNHDTNTKLKSTDDRAERYRRSHESLSAQLQVMFDHKSRLEKSLLQEKLDHKKTVDDLSAAKESSERKSQADREEMVNRLTAKNKETSLLKSQYDDLRSDCDKLEADKNKLENDMDNLRDENKREYEQMKTEKAFEITKLKDAVANQLKQIEKLQRDMQAIDNQNKNLQVLKDTALSNITKIHQDLIRVKAMSIAANTSVTNLQNANKELQALYAGSQQLVNSLQEKLRLASSLQFQGHPQGQPLGNLAIQGGLQQPQGGLQQPQGGALVMNQNQNIPPGGAALNQNNVDVGGVNVQGQNVQGENQAAVGNQEKVEEGNDVNKPVIPDANDQGNGNIFQIQPANAGVERHEGYNHEEQEDENKDADHQAAVVEHKEEDDAQHQVQPPNFVQIDNDGIEHHNPHDRMFANRRRENLKNIGLEEVDKNDQDGHDNRIKNQGPLKLQVQEPFLGRKEEETGLEEDEDEDRDENVEQQEEGIRADQFMRNAHLNKQFAPPAEHNADEHNADEHNADEDGRIEKDNYYEEEEDDMDNNNDDDYDVQRNLRRQHGQEV